MKKREFEAIGKRLLPELPGFVVKGQMLFMQPIGHTLRAIFFDRSNDPNNFYVQVFIEPLFIPSKHIGFNIGWRIGHPRPSWNADAPNLIAELTKALHCEALPFLSRIQKPRDVADAAMSLQKAKDPYVQQAIAYALVLAGEMENAVKIIDHLLSLLNIEFAWQREMADRTQMFRSLLVSNAAAAQKQLEAWEEETIRYLGLQDFR